MAYWKYSLTVAVGAWLFNHKTVSAFQKPGDIEIFNSESINNADPQFKRFSFISSPDRSNRNQEVIRKPDWISGTEDNPNGLFETYLTVTNNNKKYHNDVPANPFNWRRFPPGSYSLPDEQETDPTVSPKVPVIPDQPLPIIPDQTVPLVPDQTVPIVHYQTLPPDASHQTPSFEQTSLRGSQASFDWVATFPADPNLLTVGFLATTTGYSSDYNFIAMGLSIAGPALVLMTGAGSYYWHKLKDADLSSGGRKSDSESNVRRSDFGASETENGSDDEDDRMPSFFSEKDDGDAMGSKFEITSDAMWTDQADYSLY